MSGFEYTQQRNVEERAGIVGGGVMGVVVNVEC